MRPWALVQPPPIEQEVALTDFALPLRAPYASVARPDWLTRLGRTLRVRARFNRRRRHRQYRDFASTRAHDWLLALPQSRHGG
jgi:hypothetical protein